MHLREQRKYGHPCGWDMNKVCMSGDCTFQKLPGYLLLLVSCMSGKRHSFYFTMNSYFFVSALNGFIILLFFKSQVAKFRTSSVTQIFTKYSYKVHEPFVCRSSIFNWTELPLAGYCWRIARLPPSRICLWSPELHVTQLRFCLWSW